jgi:hypothetical protein
MKLIWTFCLLIILEIVLIGAIACPRLVYDTEFTKALSAYYQNPTNETKDKREKEGGRVRRTMMFVDMLIGSAVVVNSIALWRTGQKMATKAQQGTPPNPHSPSAQGAGGC